MSKRQRLLPIRDGAQGYSLIELLMVVTLISILGAVFLSTQSSSFVGYSRLRLAASELSGAMAKARDAAARNITVDSDCSIVQTVDQATTNVTTVLNPANCISATLLPAAINLRVRSGASDLTLSQSTVFTFRSEGMSTNVNPKITDQTIQVSDPRVDTAICINLTIPASIIRQGLIKQAGGSCDYTAK